MALVIAALLLQQTAACSGHGHSRALKGNARGLQESDYTLLVGQGDAEPAFRVNGEDRDEVLDTGSTEVAEQAVQIASRRARHLLSSGTNGRPSCGTRKYSEEEMFARELTFKKEVSKMMTSMSTMKAINASSTITINVHFHVIHNRTYGYLTDSQLKDQITVMNKAFARAGFAFKVASTKRYRNNKWFNKCLYIPEIPDFNPEGYEMKKRLRKGTYADLNVYTCISRFEKTYLSYAEFPKPKPTKQDRTLDGVTLLYFTVPGFRGFAGDTLVHEVGHWLSLYHTFQGGCKTRNGGDFIDDTPASKERYKCKPADTCPKVPGADPIHNYMAYTDDTCLSEFTKGQQKRMREAWMAFRAPFQRA